MLRTYLGSGYLFMEGKISYVTDYFDAVYGPEWFDSDWVKRIVREIDKSEYIDGEYIQSPVLGGISPRDLSSGCKALLILLNEPDKIVSGDRMGDNCYPLLFEMGKEMDLTIALSHWPELGNIEPFDIINARTGKHMHTELEFMDEYIAEERYCNETFGSY